MDKLLLGDCLTVMADIPDGSVDMVLADLPFGTTHNTWDSVIDLPSLWAQYKRVTKPNAAIVLFAQTPFDKVLGCSNLAMLRYEWIWMKEKGTGFLNAKKMPMKAHENLLVFYRSLPTYNPQMALGKVRKNGGLNRSSSNYGKFKDSVTISKAERYPKSILYFPHHNIGKLHPTEKPVLLCQYLIRTYTHEGELVLDNTCGSGTTLIAARNTGRHYIGIEKDEKYYRVAEKRLAAL